MLSRQIYNKLNNVTYTILFAYFHHPNHFNSKHTFTLSLSLFPLSLSPSPLPTTTPTLMLFHHFVFDETTMGNLNNLTKPLHGITHYAIICHTSTTSPYYLALLVEERKILVILDSIQEHHHLSPLLIFGRINT